MSAFTISLFFPSQQKNTMSISLYENVGPVLVFFILSRENYIIYIKSAIVAKKHTPPLNGHQHPLNPAVILSHHHAYHHNFLHEKLFKKQL